MKKKVKLFISATSGGHLTEAIELFGGLDDVSVVIATNSEYRREMKGVKVYVYKRAKHRYVTYLIGLIQAMWIILRERPDWTVTTGAQHGVLAIVAARVLFRKSIFVETVTRYKNATLSAKICYYLANRFYVQQKEGLKLFGPKAKYIGGLF